MLQLRLLRRHRLDAGGGLLLRVRLLGGRVVHEELLSQRAQVFVQPGRVVGLVVGLLDVGVRPGTLGLVGALVSTVGLNLKGSG